MYSLYGFSNSAVEDVISLSLCKYFWFQYVVFYTSSGSSSTKC